MTIKPAFLFGGLALLIILITFFSILTFDSEPAGFDAGDIVAFRRMKNQVLRSKVGAPFYQDAGFDSLVYYPPNASERFQTQMIPVNNGEELDLLPDRPGYPSHKIAGYAILEKEIWRDTLFILKDLEETSDTLFFIPFSDLGNGKTTYGGGRYLDVVVKPGKPVVLDFNFAYNPYCAYKEAYICARTPVMNRLSRIIEAGEMIFPPSQAIGKHPSTTP